MILSNHFNFVITQLFKLINVHITHNFEIFVSQVKMAFFTPTVLPQIIRQLILRYFPLTSEVRLIFLCYFLNLFIHWFIHSFFYEWSVALYNMFYNLKYLEIYSINQKKLNLPDECIRTKLRVAGNLVYFHLII